MKKFLKKYFYKFLKEIQLRIRIFINDSSKIKVVVGSGGVYEKGWIPTNIETIDISNEDHWRKYFKKNSIEVILAEHVWEHLTVEKGRTAAKNIFKYLKPGGYIRIAVPDGYHPDPNYIKKVDVAIDLEELQNPESHKILYNYRSLKEVFEETGYRVQLLEYYDENGIFNYNEWDRMGGIIYRSSRYKFLRSDISILRMPNFSSLIVDVIKPDKEADFM